MSEFTQKPKSNELGFGFMSDLLKVFQPAEPKVSSYAPSQFDTTFELKQLQIRVTALNSLCNRIEKRIPELSNITQASECIVDIVVIAAFVNRIAPNPVATQVLIAVGAAHAILNIIINCYDIINGDVDALDAILDIVTSIAELVPLTGANNAGDIKRTMQTGCRAASSIRRSVQPMKNNPNVIEMIHKLGDIERCFLDCEAFANQLLK